MKLPRHLVCRAVLAESATQLITPNNPNRRLFIKFFSDKDGIFAAHRHTLCALARASEKEVLAKTAKWLPEAKLLCEQESVVAGPWTEDEDGQLNKTASDDERWRLIVGKMIDELRDQQVH